MGDVRGGEVVGVRGRGEGGDGVKVKEVFEGGIAWEMGVWEAVEGEIVVPLQ